MDLSAGLWELPRELGLRAQQHISGADEGTPPEGWGKGWVTGSVAPAGLQGRIGTPPKGTKVVHVHLPDVGPVEKKLGRGVIYVKVQSWIV